jgi:hypothetical protein
MAANSTDSARSADGPIDTKNIFQAVVDRARPADLSLEAGSRADAQRPSPVVRTLEAPRRYREAAANGKDVGAKEFNAHGRL